MKMIDYNELLSRLIITDEDKLAIYGTGKAALLMMRYFEENGKAELIKFFLDNDEKCTEIKQFMGRDVIPLISVPESINKIIIASNKNYLTIEGRILEYLQEQGLENNVDIINPFFHVNSTNDILEYNKYIEKKVDIKCENLFVEDAMTSYERKDVDPKIIAWYLPQYHQIDINDRFHGKGFKEWTNTSKMIPLFTGHYQPHIPYDVGYYDLNDSNVFTRQIELAKKYGVYGFSFYYYWFSGKRIMEKPLDSYLSNKSYDFPYCLTWANENWTALWDAGNKEMICKQELLDSDDEKFIDDISKYFLDDRYIKIDNKPVLIVYKTKLWEEDRVRLLFSNFRKYIKKYNFEDIYIMVTTAGKFDESAESLGADALVEFPPHNILKDDYKRFLECYVNPYFQGEVFDMKDFIDRKEYLATHKSNKYYRGVVPMWDNSSRRAMTGANVLLGLNPSTFRQWLFDVVMESKKIHSEEENFVFINAWNEWAEGAHLEPDYKYGYAFLNVVKQVIEDTRERMNDKS